MSYKWKPSASQRRAFAEKMKDPEEQAAYETRKREKRYYENWKDKDFIPTKEQYDYAMTNREDLTSEQQDAFNQVIYGYNCQGKINHSYIHIVNEARRKAASIM